MKLRRHHAGLTMIEIAIALAVLAILGAIALPSLGARLERQRLNSAAQTLAADLANARFEAARGGAPLHLKVHAGGDWCWAVSAQPGCECGQVQSCQVRNVRADDFPAVKVSSAQAVSLDPTGRADAATVATLETKRGDRLKVELSPLGRARVCAASGSFPQLPSC